MRIVQKSSNLRDGLSYLNRMLGAITEYQKQPDSGKLENVILNARGLQSFFNELQLLAPNELIVGVRLPDGSNAEFRDGRYYPFREASKNKNYDIEDDPNKKPIVVDANYLWVILAEHIKIAAPMVEEWPLDLWLGREYYESAVSDFRKYRISWNQEQINQSQELPFKYAVEKYRASRPEFLT